MKRATSESLWLLISFEQNRRVIQQAKFIGVEGPIQKEGPIIHVMARSLYELSVETHAGRPKVTSHDFH
jgi:error-prone DNA polymerase